MNMQRGPRSRPAKNIDDYLAKVPEETRTVLERLRKVIRAAAPQAEEAISYQIPAFVYHGPLIWFAAFKDHCSFFPGSKSIIKKFSSELKPYDVSGGTIHFSAKNPLPATLIKKIVKARIEENELRAKHKKNNS